MISLMRLKLWASFLTFVLSICAFAAPDTQVYPAPIEGLKSEQKKNQTTVPQNVELDAMQMTQSPEPKLTFTRTSVLSKASQGSLSFGLGAGEGKFNKNHETTSRNFVSVTRTVYDPDDFAWDYGFAVYPMTSESLLQVFLGMKKFTPDFMPYDPFYKFGIAGIYDPKDQLGNVVDYQRYVGFASVGLENILKYQRRLRMELTVQSGYLGASALAQLMLAFPD